MSVLSCDFETRATVDLRTAGVYRYAQHPDTDIWCMAWAFDDEEPEIWVPDWDMPGLCNLLPQRIWDHITTGGEIRAHNAQFERVIWNEIMVKRYGKPPIKLEQWVCSAAEAAAMALPRSLDELARVLKVAETKDQEGYALMLRMSRPRKVNDDGTIIWWNVPDRLARLYEYCKQDVRTEHACSKALRRLTAKERAIYVLDQRINDRGVYIDRPLVLAAKEIVNEGVERANGVLSELTRGEVTAVTNHGRLTEWLHSQSVDTPGVSKPAVRDLLESDLSPTVRAVLETRSEAGRSSVAKLEAFLECACDDDRVRGLLLYHAASTGRWAGRLLQPQNFPRGEIKNVEDFIPDVTAGAYDTIDLFAPPIAVVSSLLRSMIMAAAGCEFIAADYSAIEARVLNWLAGQDDIVALFAQGEDVYKHNAARLYNIPLSSVQKMPHRQTGKFQELACGYGMGAKKAVSAAKAVYELEIDEKTAKTIVDAYRASHTKVVAFWYETERAALTAVTNPGETVTFGALRNLAFLKAGNYLYLKLPSGRPLVYPAPRVVDGETPWGEIKPQLEYSGVDTYTRHWGRLRAYGGLLVENIVQAVSRDLMAEGMLRLEDAGYPVVLSVHDEVVAEVPEGFGFVEEFERLLAELPQWAAGCPVAAEGWRGQRYRK